MTTRWHIYWWHPHCCMPPSWNRRMSGHHGCPWDISAVLVNVFHDAWHVIIWIVEGRDGLVSWLLPDRFHLEMMEFPHNFSDEWCIGRVSPCSYWVPFGFEAIEITIIKIHKECWLYLMQNHPSARKSHDKIHPSMGCFRAIPKVNDLWSETLQTFVGQASLLFWFEPLSREIFFKLKTEDTLQDFVGSSSSISSKSKFHQILWFLWVISWNVV